MRSMSESSSPDLGVVDVVVIVHTAERIGFEMSISSGSLGDLSPHWPQELGF